jgi:hypothetical protein
MRWHPLPQEDISAPCARVQPLHSESQYTRWWATQMRQLAPLARLALHMPQANPLTLAITVRILAQHGLLAHASPPETRPLPAD